MLSKTELSKLREILERAQNPLFFFDNDTDGLCSYILLKKNLQRGKGVAIKSFPELTESNLRKVDELNPDYVFILDYSLISKEFIAGLQEKNVPLVVIDHHKVENRDYIKDYAEVFNSLKEPTTYICHNLFNKKENEWLTLVGCIADVFKPDFSEEFAEENPELFDNDLETFNCLYKTEIGKVARMLDSGLRDSTTNILKLMKFLEKTNSISDILQETKETKELHKKFNKMESYIEKVILKAKKTEKLVLLEYSGENSLSSEISNKLLLDNRNKLIIVAFKRSDYCNISIRGKRSREILLKSMEGIEGASGGGHEEACGGRIPTDNWEAFKEKIMKELN